MEWQGQCGGARSLPWVGMESTWGGPAWAEKPLSSDGVGRRSSQEHTARQRSRDMAGSCPGSTHRSSQPQKWGGLRHRPHWPTHALCTQCLAPAHPAQPLRLPQKPAGIALGLGVRMEGSSRASQAPAPCPAWTPKKQPVFHPDLSPITLPNP